MEIDDVTTKYKKKLPSYKPPSQPKHTTKAKTPNERSCYRCGKPRLHMVKDNALQKMSFIIHVAKEDITVKCVNL